MGLEIFLILLFILAYPVFEFIFLLDIINARYIKTWDKVIIPPKKEHQLFSDLRFRFLNHFPKIRIFQDRLPEFLFIHRYFMNRGYICMLKHPDYNPEIPHNGIIIAHGEYSQKLGYGDGVDLIIQKFHEKNIAYKIYDCQSIRNFKDIVRNPMVKKIWIFGHGERGGIRIGFECLEYQVEFHNEPESIKKDYIHQFHCNGGIKPSLADLLSDGRGYVSNTYRTQLQNREHVRQILELNSETIFTKIGDV